MSRPGPIFPCPTYRVAYVGAGARRAYVDDSDHGYSLALALKIVRQLKARGYTPWVEDEYGAFVPVQGVTRRPSYRDEKGRTIPAGQRMLPILPGKGLRPADNPLLPGPPPQYVMGGMGMPEVWRYRGYDIEVIPSNGDFKACYVHPEDGRQCPIARDVQSALGNARHRIDISEMPEGWWDAEHVVHMTLDHYAETATTPINRGRIARHIEELRAHPVKGVPIHRHSYEQFDNLSLPDRLRLIDEVIDYQERAGLWDPQRRTKNPSDDPPGTVAELLSW